MEGLGERLPPKVLDHCLHLAQDMLPLTLLRRTIWLSAWLHSHSPEYWVGLSRRRGLAATVIPWNIVLCSVVEYKWNTDSCDLYLHVIMTLRLTALYLRPMSNGLMLSFSPSRPASSMVGFWQLLFAVDFLFVFVLTWSAWSPACQTTRTHNSLKVSNAQTEYFVGHNCRSLIMKIY